MKTHESHAFDEQNWRCGRCGCSPLAIDAKLRCVPIIAEEGFVDFTPCDVQPTEGQAELF